MVPTGTCILQATKYSALPNTKSTRHWHFKGKELHNCIEYFPFEFCPTQNSIEQINYTEVYG